jgi:hypothetical protein
MPATIAVPPSSWAGPTTSWNATAPVRPPTSGSRLTNAPASSAVTRACAQANSQKANSVPVRASASTAAIASPPAGAGGAPSRTIANGSADTAPAPSWTAVTAAGSRPASRPGWPTMNADDAVTDSSTSRSPASDVPVPPPPATRPTPASASSEPAHMSRPPEPRPSTAAMAATSTGTAPTISAAWLTLVRSMPAFWSTITTP